MTATEPQVFTHGGQSVTLPVQVGHARQAAATFLVDADAAQRVIDETGLRVKRQARGKAVVSIALVEYLENDLGTYDELALAFVVDDVPGTPPGPKGSVSTYIHRLPVDGEFTCAAGRGIWGFPKWVADLDVTFDERGATAVLREGELEVLRVTMLRGPVPLDDDAQRAVALLARALGRRPRGPRSLRARRELVFHLSSGPRRGTIGRSSCIPSSRSRA